MHFNSTSDTIIALAAPQQIKLQVQSHLVVLSLFWETKILHPPKLAAETSHRCRSPAERGGGDRKAHSVCSDEHREAARLSHRETGCFPELWLSRFWMGDRGRALGFWMQAVGVLRGRQGPLCPERHPPSSPHVPCAPFLCRDRPATKATHILEGQTGAGAKISASSSLLRPRAPTAPCACHSRALPGTIPGGSR